jgi:hypothetical protein
VRPTRSDTIRVMRPDHSVRSEVLSPTLYRDMRWQSHHIITTPLLECRTAFLCRCLVLDRQNTSELMIISMDLFSETRLSCFHSRFSKHLIKSNLVFLTNPFLPPSNSNFCSSENSMLLSCLAASRLSKRLARSSLLMTSLTF